MAGKARRFFQGSADQRSVALIFVAVGTFVHGFDDLVAAADYAAADLGLEGFAQIGHSTVVPTTLKYARFLTADQLAKALKASELTICHAGMGLIGDSLRAGCRTLIVPRRGTTTGRHPANDQLLFARKIASMLPVMLCEELEDISSLVESALKAPHPLVDLETNAPEVIVDFLETTSKQPHTQSSR